MITITNTQVDGWTAAVRGMRNPLNSWDKSDSYNSYEYGLCIGNNDLELMKKLCKAGSDHRKFMRFITVTADINAPLYYWKQLDTYKVGTVCNSTSTMHTIHKKPFELSDFSIEHLRSAAVNEFEKYLDVLNAEREAYTGEDYGCKLKGDKQCWYSIIQMLPESYNQLRTWQGNYEVLHNIYHSRRKHKLDEWQSFCRWVEKLPHSELITDDLK